MLRPARGAKAADIPGECAWHPRCSGVPVHMDIRHETMWVVTPHQRSGERCVKSRGALAVGEVLASFDASTVSERPTRMTVQIAEHTHITLAPASLAFINHGC